jgi:hypothetical protein
VEWINDSSCNVIFRDDVSASRAVVGLGDPLAEEGALGPLDPSETDRLAWHWHRGKQPYVKEGVDFELQVRRDWFSSFLLKICTCSPFTEHFIHARCIVFYP